MLVATLCERRINFSFLRFRATVIDRRYRRMPKIICKSLPVLLLAISIVHAEPPHILPPPSGKLYHGFYWGGVGTDTHDPTEHDVAPADVARYEQAIGKKTAWVYFSNNWFESRKFPVAMCRWIRDLGKIPYLRLMLRSDVDQKHGEKAFSLQKIIVGEFDVDLRMWARDAKRFGTVILIEWGTEPNGDWFSWNGKWNGGADEGPKRYIAAYRHIVDLMRAEGADNLTWVWHVNWDDDPGELGRRPGSKMECARKLFSWRELLRLGSAQRLWPAYASHPRRLRAVPV